MSKDEVELGGGDGADEDYEVVPVGPIRKLERRIDEMEEKSQQKSSSTNDELVRDVLDIMKSNQKIVNDMTESTHELKNSVEDLTHKMDSVIDNLNSFMDLLEEASEMDIEDQVVSDIQGNITESVESQLQNFTEELSTSNKELVNQLNEINENLERNYAEFNKNDILDKNKQNQSRESSSMRESKLGNMRQGSQRNNQDNRDRQRDSENDNRRIDELKKKFDKRGNNE